MKRADGKMKEKKMKAGGCVSFIEPAEVSLERYADGNMRFLPMAGITGQCGGLECVLAIPSSDEESQKTTYTARCP